MVEWLASHVGLVCWSVGASVVMTIGAAAGLVCLPPDYFADSGTSGHRPGRFRILRNVLGSLLILSGIALLVLPGPGALLLIFGLSLTDLPGKQRAVRWLLSRGPVLNSANRLRRLFGREALEAPKGGRASRAAGGELKQSRPKPV